MTAKMAEARTRRRIAGEETWQIAATEYRRMLELLRTLGEVDWPLPTDCTAWDVRAMLGHLVGAAEGIASPPEMFHQYRAGAKLVRAGRTDGTRPVDGGNAVQVAERADATTSELIARYEVVIPRALRWRRRLRWIPVSMDDDGGRFSMRELYEVVLTRDIWIHRVDISRATGRAMVLTPEHDGRIVEDCVIDWAKKHGRPFNLLLTGRAGGGFDSHTGQAPVEIDAVEFVRALSGRGKHSATMGTRIVF